MTSWTKRIAGAMTALALSAGIAAATEIRIVDEADYGGDREKAIVSTLMQPISPLVAGQAGNTTSIAQIGTGHSVNSAIEGHSSASLIAQEGTRNRAVQAIQGSNSALLLVQSGTNNNVLQASRGDNNFQLVGVSGSNNDIGYVQVGDNLAGVLDLRNSHNTTVVALQTNRSSNYLMPTGISGLKNAAVVIVPGKMYVLPKR
ncbi:MAG: hypothetical protein ACT6QU_17015 [Aliihoeflea sp.]|uniref:hypothetical protein n=1 Tax=Aliihoeflea sp. TaxID=2608088 RepID=UPI004034E999